MKTANKKIYLLIGAKGSGKSYIGTLFEAKFNIKFIRVEDWAKSVKRGRNVDDQSYVEEVFALIERGIRKELITSDKIVFESTGLSDAFDRMLNNLKPDYSLVTIFVTADEELCLNRVKTREQAMHIHVSDDQVRMINSRVRQKSFATDFTLNNNSTDLVELEKCVSAIVNQGIG